MFEREKVVYRILPAWTNKGIFAVTIDDRLGLVKLRFREVGQEPYKEQQ